MKGENELKIFTDPELEELTKTSRTLRWRERKAGRLGYCLISNQVRYTEDQVKAWLARCERPAKGAASERN